MNVDQFTWDTGLSWFEQTTLSGLPLLLEHTEKLGSFGSWKSWKVLEFYSGIFQDWKVLEN